MKLTMRKTILKRPKMGPGSVEHSPNDYQHMVDFYEETKKTSAYIVT